MTDILKWVTNPRNRACNAGRDRAREYKDKDPREYWESLDTTEFYMFGVISRSPEIALSMTMKLVRTMLHGNNLPRPLAIARLVAVNPDATTKGLNEQFKIVTREREKILKKYKHYYEAIYHLLRWRLGYTKPMVCMKIMLRARDVMFEFNYPAKDMKSHFVDFFKKEHPYEEWKRVLDETES